MELTTRRHDIEDFDDLELLVFQFYLLPRLRRLNLGEDCAWMIDSHDHVTYFVHSHRSDLLFAEVAVPQFERQIGSQVAHNDISDESVFLAELFESLAFDDLQDGGVTGSAHCG